MPKCYVRPVFEYGDVVWHSGLCTKQIADLERIQRRACRTILNRIGMLLASVIWSI